jgi:NADH-quinone oxidoreductase subunit E
MEDWKEQEKEILDHLGDELTHFEKSRPQLIPILQRVQDKLKYLPPEAIKLVADYLELPESQVYGVATFYNQFRFNPPGKHPIKVCLGTACHVRGGDIILENFERKLEIKEGETTPDREFSVERVACVGCCALAPVALVGDEVHGKMAPSKVEGLILGFQIQKEREERLAREGQEKPSEESE